MIWKAFLKGTTMSSEEIISEIDDVLNKENRYTILEYINKNTGVFISAISIIAALVVFLARTISFLVVRAKYVFWDLDEGFIVEDNKAILKLGMYILYFVSLTVINLLTSRYAYRWELYNCELYLYNRIIIYRKKMLKKCKRKREKLHKSLILYNNQYKTRAELTKSADSIENSYYSINEKCRNDILQFDKDYKILKKDIYSLRRNNWKNRLKQMAKFLSVLLFVFGASIILQLFLGVDIEAIWTISVVSSTAIITLLIMFTAFFGAFLEIRVMVHFVLKRSFKDKNIDWSTDCIMPIIDWLESKSVEIKNQSIKAFLSDRSLKTLLLNIILTTIGMTIFLPFIVKDSLKRMDSFYVFRDNQQNYVMLINDGTKYIFSGCEIKENTLIIDTDEIIIRNDPVDLEKIQFEIVERKQ